MTRPATVAASTPLWALTPPFAAGPVPPGIALKEHLARLHAQIRDAMRLRHYAFASERAYLAWVSRFVFFHGRPVHEMGAAEVRRFLSRLAAGRAVSASTQNQAHSALLFLYRDVLGRDLPATRSMQRARPASRLPVVLSRAECIAVLRRMPRPERLIAALLYGGGLRLRECCRLRVQDIDFERRQIVVRDGKGAKDRVSILPLRLVAPLRNHLAAVRLQHQADLAEGAGSVELPSASPTPPRAAWEWPRQWVFPSPRLHPRPDNALRCRFSGGLDPAFSGAFLPGVPPRDGLFLS